MILGFPDKQKAPTDVIIVTLDWTPFVPEGITDVTNRSVTTESGSVTAENDSSVTSGLTQKIKLSGGTCNEATYVKAHIECDGGIDLTRAFLVMVG